MKFVKLEVRDNWGHYEYTTPEGKVVDPKGIVKVRWPSGKIMDHHIHRQSVGQNISDHGHMYYASSVKIYINHYVEGVLARIPIENVEVYLDE